MGDENLIAEIQEIENKFNQAVISNKIEEIKKCVTEDWVLGSRRMDNKRL